MLLRWNDPVMNMRRYKQRMDTLAAAVAETDIGPAA